MPDTFLMRYPVGGMNHASPATLLAPREAAEMVNCRVSSSTVRTRPGVRVHELPETEGLAFQGACFYNPSQGLSQQVQGEDESMIVFSAGGRKFKVSVTDESVENSDIQVSEVLGVAPTNPIYHLVWMAQAENYIIAQDGNSSTWIWDGDTPARFSPGYNTTDKESSRLANGASLVAYAHGRVVQVVNGRQVLVGDIIHKDGTSSSANVLGMTEQVYWATGSFFSPPSALGMIMAVAPLPLKNTTHGHGDLVFHCEEGIFSLDITLYPRESWVDNAISKHLSLDAAAAGFYAITLYDSDQIYLTRNGLHSLRSAAQINQIGNPQRPLSERVGRYIERDSAELFRFASVCKSVRDNRLFVTTDHLIDDAVHRGARGILSLNFRPSPSEESICWEGLWTLPAEAYLINQVVSGVFSSRERTFAFVTGKDRKMRLVEFSQNLNHDITVDGKEKAIEWQVVTRADVLGNETSNKTWEDGVVTLKNVVGQASVKTFIRNDQCDWIPYREACFEGADECTYGMPSSREYRLDLGKPPSAIKPCRWVQLLIKVTGQASIETVRMTASIDKGGEHQGNIPSSCIKLDPNEGSVFEFNPFSYQD